MQAIVMRTTGGVDVLRQEEVARPRVGARRLERTREVDVVVDLRRQRARARHAVVEFGATDAAVDLAQGVIRNDGMGAAPCAALIQGAASVARATTTAMRLKKIVMALTRQSASKGCRL